MLQKWVKGAAWKPLDPSIWESESLNTTQINISPSEKYANTALPCNLIAPLIPAPVIYVHKESRLQWTSFEHVILNISAASALRQAKLMNVTVLLFFVFFVSSMCFPEIGMKLSTVLAYREIRSAICICFHYPNIASYRKLAEGLREKS